MADLAQKRLTSTQIDDELWSHFCALGVGSVSAYKLWCRRNSLDTDLPLNPEQRLADLEIHRSLQPPVDPDIDRDHDPVRAALVERIFRGELRDQPLTDVPSRIRKLYDALDGDEETRQALKRLVLHTEKYSRLYRPTPMFKRWGHAMTNTCITALGQLARHHRDWCRPVETWRPDTHKQRPQFSSLVRHLLARYEVPIVMDTAWFQGDTPEARRQQEWFKHVGFGQNIRTAGVPMTITKRMAHLFLQENNRHSTLIQALRRVQVAALGGHPHLAWEVSMSALGDSFDNEEFWVTVVHFFVNNHPMLSRTYVEPILDYVRHQKYEPQRITRADGSRVEGSPPQPNFSMKGRGADKLLRQVDEWHAQLSGLEDIPFKSWESCGLREFAHREIDPELNRRVEWSIHELTTSAQLGVEGRIMHHCVGSYTDRCMSGRNSIWSLRIVDLEAEEPEPMHVLTIAVDPKHRTVTEARGKYNLKPFDRMRVSRKRRTTGLYIRFLRESARIMKMWMDREGLTHA